MVRYALYVPLQAKPGQEQAVADFLRGALPLVEAEAGTTAWFALQMGPDRFAIFDAFADQEARAAHLGGEVAAALTAKAGELFAVPPKIHQIDVLAAKLPG